MKKLYRIFEVANRILMSVVLLFSLIAVIYGAYVLIDIISIRKNAFVSHDLLQYRPALNTSEESEGHPETFTELKKINSDTVGWVELFGTHINYPVVQGKDDLEYLNKDFYGNSTLSGSIYLAARNDRGFNDWYSILYGHHMDNGAMFGDISKYLDKDYFDSHTSGVLQTDNGEYTINVFACVSTNSYDGTIYILSDDYETRYPVLREYISSHADNMNDIPESLDNKHILAFSTCTDATTNGRIVLFAEVEAVAAGQHIEIPYNAVEDKEEPVIRKLIASIGDMSYSSQWALLNLICVIYTLITLFPLLSLRRKYRQIRYSKKKYDELEKMESPDDRAKDICNDLKGFILKMRIGILVEAIIFIVSAVVFILTENISKKVTVCDEWTWIMLLMAAISLLADFIFFRYRGIRPDDEEKSEMAEK